MKIHWRRTAPSSAPLPLICSSCSSDVPAGATTCRICGSVITRETTRKAAPRPKPTFSDTFNYTANGVNNESRGLWGPERYDPKDGQPK